MRAPLRPRLIPASLLLALLLTGLRPASPACAQLPRAVQAFDEGNRHYQQGAFREAVRAYEQALASGYASGTLYYNLGNAYFRLDALGQAIRHYEKARRYLPDDVRLTHNLTLARSRIDPPISSLPVPPWKTWWQRHVVLNGPWPFFLAGLAFYLLAAGLVGHRIWTGRPNAWRRRALAAALAIGLLLLAAAFGASLDRQIDRLAVVVVPHASLHDAPAQPAPEAEAVPEGVLVRILDRSGEWVEVRLPDGTTGWLPANATADV